jgi:hypothetical protein
VTVSRHHVRATRSQKYWLIWIDGELRTQAKRQGDIEETARDWLSLIHDRDGSAFALEVEVDLPADATAHLERAAVFRAESERARVAAARETAAAALVLHDAGLTVREIGPLLHVSHQRAHQLVTAAR